MNPLGERNGRYMIDNAYECILIHQRKAAGISLINIRNRQEAREKREAEPGSIRRSAESFRASRVS